MNIRSNAARTLAVSILSIAGLAVSGAANAQHHGDSHASGGGGGGGGHSAPYGGGGGGGGGRSSVPGGHGGYGGPGPAMRGPVGYRGPATIGRGFSPSQAPSAHGWNGGSASHGAPGRGAPGRGYGAGSYSGHGHVDHRAYTPVHGRGGWGQTGGWYDYRPYWTFVGVLPWYYTTSWWNGVPYYFADSTYYLWSDSAAQYQVVPPPANADDAALAQAPAAAADFYVYPNAGQSAEQQATDRYECHRWAVDQTGFDPTRATGGVAPEAAGEAGDAYHRAEGACLQGRGYTVR